MDRVGLFITTKNQMSINRGENKLIYTYPIEYYMIAKITDSYNYQLRNRHPYNIQQKS